MRQRHSYTPKELAAAYRAVQQGTMNVTAAARMFGIPRQTLKDRLKFQRGPGILRRHQYSQLDHQPELSPT